MTQLLRSEASLLTPPISNSTQNQWVEQSGGVRFSLLLNSSPTPNSDRKINMLRRKEELGVSSLFYEWVAREMQPILTRITARAQPILTFLCGHRWLA